MIQPITKTIETNIQDLIFWNEQINKAKTPEEKRQCIRQMIAGINLITEQINKLINQ